jgi:hypothetical protein
MTEPGMLFDLCHYLRPGMRIGWYQLIFGYSGNLARLSSNKSLQMTFDQLADFSDNKKTVTSGESSKE